VSLHGKVPANDDKQKAEVVTKQIVGVKSVRNLLQVVPPERAEAVEATDAAIRAALETAIHADRALPERRSSSGP